MSRDDPETLLQMVRETESENRRLGAEVSRLRAEMAALRSRELTPEEAGVCVKMVPHQGHCLIWNGPTFICNCSRGPLIEKLSQLRSRSLTGDSVKP